MTVKVKRYTLLSLLLVCLIGAEGVTNASELGDWMYDTYDTELYGFVEARQGWRLQNDLHEDDETISEVRSQLTISKDFGWGIGRFKGDAVADRVLEEVRGELRELNLAFFPSDMMDMKVGRQIQTWGTGDLLFINDLFPKDWESFFIGRDDEYLKAPSDSIRAGIFFDFVNINISYTPLFKGSEYIDGHRLSFWNGSRIAGKDSPFNDDERNRLFNDDEIAVRISKTVQSTEIALYGYEGFWQSPEGINIAAGRGFYPRLRSIGGSMRAPVLGGIGNIEAGYYDSYQDRDGNDPFIRNSEARFLGGYEKELGMDFTGSVQYYLEWMSSYDEYTAALLPGSVQKDEYRHVLTLRLTKLLMKQNLKLSIFSYYSPSDEDGYLRPKVHYKISDALAVEAGGNIFFGEHDHTFFGQFSDNTNLYAGVRYSF